MRLRATAAASCVSQARTNAARATRTFSPAVASRALGEVGERQRPCEVHHHAASVSNHKPTAPNANARQLRSAPYSPPSEAPAAFTGSDADAATVLCVEGTLCGAAGVEDDAFAITAGSTSIS